ncbi:transposase [Bdellovibrionota bacterium FG-1]
MAQNKQPTLPGFNFKTSGASHGGDLNQGKRKTARPIDPKQAVHLVLRSSMARGQYSMLRKANSEAIEALLQKLAKKWDVRVFRYANVGNHLHLLLRVRSRAVWKRFLRQFAGGIAMIVTGARKGHGRAPNSTGRTFWDELAFTRIVNFGRDFDRVARYLVKNLFEAMGIPMKELLAEGYRICVISKTGLVPI